MNPSAPVTVVVMGVSGCGKSTVGQYVASALGWRWADGDDFHSAAAVQKMASGQPLSEADRSPWLRSIGTWIDAGERAGLSAVLACSALRRTHRATLLEGRPSVTFLHLVVSEPVLRQRMESRQGHFMPSALLASQVATLQPLGQNEPGIALEADRPVEELGAAYMAWLREDRPDIS